MLQLNKIESQASPYWDSLALVYHTSFPIDEQRPIEDITRLIEHDLRFIAYAITDNSDTFVGMLTTWHFDEFIHIEHFAIVPALRSQGYGSKALQTYIATQRKPIILEAEPPTDDITRRRIQFYQRSGLTLHEYPYIQPAYTPERNPVPLRLMGTINTEIISLPHITMTLHREVYGVQE